MILGPAVITSCETSVDPTTIRRIIQVESKGDPLAINVNGARLARKPRDAADAAALATAYIRKGYSVDLGLMQVNSNNLAQLGYTVADMFETCKNIAAGAAILTNFYASASVHYEDEQTALRAALSAYNTGDFRKGIANGYVARYFVNTAGGRGATANTPVLLARDPAPTADAPRSRPARSANSYTAATLLWRRSEDAAMKHETTKPIISTNEADAMTPGVQVEQTAEQAERNGAFEETAMSEADAWESNGDLTANDKPAATVAGR